MKNMRAIWAGAVLMAFLSGCGNSGAYLPTAQDITNVELIRVMALDRGEEKAVRVSVSGATGGSSENAEEEPPAVLSEEGETVFAACLAMQTGGDNYVSYGAVDQCLVHEAAVEKELTGLLDFLERDYEMRMDASLFVAQGARAETYLRKMAEENNSAADRLASIARDFPLESQGWEVTVRDVLMDLSDSGCALVPAVSLQKEGEGSNIRSEGMAWVTEQGVQAVFQGEEARSAAILSGRAEGGCIEVVLPEDTVAGLRLTAVRCRWEPLWEGEALTGALCRIELKADIAELRGGADPMERAVLEQLEGSAEKQLREQLSGVLQRAQRGGGDLFRLRRKLALKQPWRSAAIERQWEERYPTFKWEIAVDCTVERSYDVDRGTVGR